jgi:hypothetical protein
MFIIKLRVMGVGGAFILVPKWHVQVRGRSEFLLSGFAPEISGEGSMSHTSREGDLKNYYHQLIWLNSLRALPTEVAVSPSHPSASLSGSGSFIRRSSEAFSASLRNGLPTDECETFSVSGTGLSIFPVMVSRLKTEVGAGWGVRLGAFLILIRLVVANLMVNTQVVPAVSSSFDPKEFFL